VDAHESSAGLNEPAQIGLLGIIKYVSGRTKKDDGGVLLQVLFVDEFGLFRGVYEEAVCCAQLLNGGLPILDGSVAVTGRFAENKDAWCAVN
jgi:hypothetical protein